MKYDLNALRDSNTPIDQIWSVIDDEVLGAANASRTVERRCFNASVAMFEAMKRENWLSSPEGKATLSGLIFADGKKGTTNTRKAWLLGHAKQIAALNASLPRKVVTEEHKADKKRVNDAISRLTTAFFAGAFLLHWTSASESRVVRQDAKTSRIILATVTGATEKSDVLSLGQMKTALLRDFYGVKPAAHTIDPAKDTSKPQGQANALTVLLSVKLDAKARKDEPAPISQHTIAALLRLRSLINRAEEEGLLVVSEETVAEDEDGKAAGDKIEAEDKARAKAAVETATTRAVRHYGKMLANGRNA